MKWDNSNTLWLHFPKTGPVVIDHDLYTVCLVKRSITVEMDYMQFMKIRSQCHSRVYVWNKEIDGTYFRVVNYRPSCSFRPIVIVELQPERSMVDEYLLNRAMWRDAMPYIPDPRIFISNITE